MAFRYHQGARINPNSPRAIAVCDRCNFTRQLTDLRAQMRYAGFSVVNTGLMVCERCLDPLNPQDRPILTTADPLPVPNPRPLNMGPQETSNRATQVLDLRITEDDEFRIVQTTLDDD